MDRDYPSSRSELEDPDDWSYNDLQQLAADLDYGTIVGAPRDDLVDHAVDALELPTEPTDGDHAKRLHTDDHATELHTDRDREGDRGIEGPTIDQQSESGSRSTTVESSGGEDHSTGRDRERGGIEGPTGKTDGGTQTEASTDEIAVGHEGSEKLQPENAPDADGTAVAPPEGLDPDDMDPDLLEPEQGESPTESASRSTTVEQEGSQDVDGDESADSGDNDSDNQSSGGLRDRLGIGSSDESPEDVVEEADDPEERARREEFKQKLEGAVDGADQEDVDEALEDQEAGRDDPSAGSTTTAQGMVMDQEVVGSLIEMPFNTASAATGWDGWELSEQERRANARLFVAMCDERDIDVSATTMFGLSMASTFGGKAVRYRRHKENDQDGAEEPDEDLEDDAGAGDDVQEADRSRAPVDRENESENSGEDDFGF